MDRRDLSPNRGRLKRQARWLTVLLVSVGQAYCDRPSPPTAGQPASAAAVEPVAAVSAEAIATSLDAAEHYFNGGDLAKARAILKRLIEKAPRQPRARELFGQVLAREAIEANQRGDAAIGESSFRQAYEQYRLATVLDGSSAGLHQSAGEIASAAGLADLALDHFRAAGRLDPDAAKHPLYEAQILIQRRRFDEALEALERVLELDPEEPFAFASRAAIALERGDCPGALRQVLEARRIDGANLAIRVQQARIHRRCDEPRRALELLVTLGDRERSEAAVTGEISAGFRDLGEPVKAAEAWEHRLLRHPAAWRAALGAAEAWLEAGERERARIYLRKARLAAPDSAEVRALEEAMSHEP